MISGEAYRLIGTHMVQRRWWQLNQLASYNEHNTHAIMLS
jgi:hypothetical protein